MRFIAGIFAVLIFFTPALCETPASAPTIHIEIVDKATGEPIGGAEVLTYHEQTATDEYGQCAVGVPETGLWNFSITVSQPGYASMVVRWTRVKAGQKFPSQLVFAMSPGISIGGTVVDETGKPVSGALVHLSGGSDEKRDGIPHAVLLADVRSDADGKWTTNTAPADLGQVKVNVTHADFYSDMSDHDAPPARQLRERTAVIVIQHAATITGRVLDPAGNAVANAMILASDKLGFEIHHRTRTDANGEFSLTQMPPGAASFIVESSKFAPQMVTTATPATQPVLVHLESGVRLQLHVVDLAGKPLARVAVDLDQWQNVNLLEYHLRTDADGNATWPQAPAEEMKFNLSKPGFGNITDFSATPATQPVTVRMGPPTQIIGTVIDATTRQPIKDFQILCGIGAGDDQDMYWSSSLPHQEHDGRFTYALRDAENPQYQIRAEADGYMSVESRRFTGSEGALALTFQMEKSAPVSGSVFDFRHHPVAGATVIMATDSRSPLDFQDGKMSDWDQPSAQSVQTDVGGRFTFQPEGKAFNLICMNDAGYAQLDAPVVHLSRDAIFRATYAGQTIPTTRPAAWDLLLQRWAVVEGKLLKGAYPGAKEKMCVTCFPGVDLVTQPRMQFTYNTITDSAGRFRFDRVPPGTARIYQLIPRGEGMAYSQDTLVTVTSGQTTSVQIGGVGRPVVGRFKYPDGIRPETWSAITAYITTHTPLPPGPHMPAAIQHASRDAREKWMIDWAATPAGKAFIAAETKRGDDPSVHNYALQVQPDGTFRIDDVPAGTYDLLANFWSTGPMTMASVNRSVGSAEKMLTVPPMPGGRGDQPLDIGSVPITNPAQPRK